jgi:hypothetical protein
LLAHSHFFKKKLDWKGLATLTEYNLRNCGTRGPTEKILKSWLSIINGLTTTAPSTTAQTKGVE